MSPVIEVSTEVVGDTLRVTVADNGDGMSDDVIDRILDFGVTV